MHSIGLNTGLHPDFGSGTYGGGPIGIPYTTVSEDQKKVPVHFHYAGFAATIMSAVAFRAMRDRPRRLRLGSATAGLLVVIATPLTATGIATGTAALTVIGPVLLAIGILGTAALTALVIAPALPKPTARWLLIISAAGIVIPMLLGVDYAAGRVLPIPALDLGTMALVHGTLNAVVYSLLGLAGWSLA